MAPNAIAKPLCFLTKTMLSEHPTTIIWSHSARIRGRRISAVHNFSPGSTKAMLSETSSCESLVLGADGWVAGLVCAFPRETVAIYNLIKELK